MAGLLDYTTERHADRPPLKILPSFGVARHPFAASLGTTINQTLCSELRLNLCHDVFATDLPTMLVNARFRTFVLIALPCVVFIYLLQRNSEYGTSQVIDSFHHYTQKFKDLGAIQAVKNQAHKWSETLPWTTKPTEASDNAQTVDASELYFDNPEITTEQQPEYIEDMTQPYVDYTEDTTQSYVDYTEDATAPYVDYTEDSTEPYAHYPEDSTEPYVHNTEDSTEPYIHYTDDSTAPYIHYADDSTEPSVHHTGGSTEPYVHLGGDLTGSSVHDTGDSKESYTDYAEDKASSAGTTTASSASHSGASSGSGSTAVKLPHLQNLCRETKWTEGLWLQCTSYCGPTQTAWCGGLNNGRTRLQNCLRLAIDAGAGVILPQISLRGVGEAGVTIPGHDSCADDWFDLAYTENAIRTNCPQLNLRASCPDALDRSVALAAPPETDLEVVHSPHYIDGMYVKGEFRENLILPTLRDANRINGSSGALVDGTNIVEYGDTFIGWNYNKSNEFHTVRKDLYKTIRFRESMHQIGERVRGSEQLQHGSYIAVHLRGEGDWPAEWGTPDQQMAIYIDEIARIRATDQGSNISAVFASSGEQGVIQAFRDRLQSLNYTVYDKWSLLADFPSELANVQQADFDAMGIVDDAVLTGAMYFMGVSVISLPTLPFWIDANCLDFSIAVDEYVQPERRLREDDRRR